MSQLYHGIEAIPEDETNLLVDFRDTPYWNERVSTAQQQLEALMRQQEEEKTEHYKNPSANLGEIYNDITLQSGADMQYRNFRDSK